MRTRPPIWGAPAAAAAVAVLALAGGRDGASGPRAAPTLSVARAPVAGVLHRPHGPDALVRLRPRTLRPFSRRIPVRGDLWASAWSSDGRRLAIAAARTDVAEGRVVRTRVQVVEARRWRVTRELDAGRREITLMLWGGRDRLFALAGRRRGGHDVLVFDAALRRFERVRLPGQPVNDNFRPTAEGIAVLVAPRGRIGPATLVTVGADSRLRKIPLGVQAGFPTPLDGGHLQPGRQRVPALAVHAAGRRAFVVSAETTRVIEVDLASGVSATHVPERERGLLARIGDLIEPAAEAKALVGPVRQALVLDDGTLAVSGFDESVDAEGHHRVAYGLHLVDTRDWSLRTVDENVSWFAAAPGTLLVADGGYGENSGLVALEPGGRKRFQVLRGDDVSVVGSDGDVLYVWPWAAHERTLVIDLRSGRRVATPRRDPTLQVIPR